MNIHLHNHYFICLLIAYEHIHLAPGTSYSVMNVRVAAQVQVYTFVSKVFSNCLIYLKTQQKQPYFV